MTERRGDPEVHALLEQAGQDPETKRAAWELLQLYRAEAQQAVLAVWFGLSELVLKDCEERLRGRLRWPGVESGLRRVGPEPDRFVSGPPLFARTIR